MGAGAPCGSHCSSVYIYEETEMKHGNQTPGTAVHPWVWVIFFFNPHTFISYCSIFLPHIINFHSVCNPPHRLLLFLLNSILLRN